jgi:hypothetical protein
MDPKRVSTVLGEFKSPAEKSRAQVLFDKWRKNDVKPPEAAAKGTSNSPAGGTASADMFR